MEHTVYDERICTRCGRLVPSGETLHVKTHTVQLCGDCLERRLERKVRLVKALGVMDCTFAKHVRRDVARALASEFGGPPIRIEHDHAVAQEREAKLGGYESGTYSRGPHYSDIGYR